MAHEVLCQDSCKLIFPYMQTLAEEQEKSDHKNNIAVQSSKGNIILDCHIKIDDYWVEGVKFVQETGNKRAQLANAFTKKVVSNLCPKLGHPSEVITSATAKSMDIHLTSTFKPCEDCALCKENKGCISERIVVCSKILGERFFLMLAYLQIPLVEVERIGC